MNEGFVFTIVSYIKSTLISLIQLINNLIKNIPSNVFKEAISSEIASFFIFSFENQL